MNDNNNDFIHNVEMVSNTDFTNNKKVPLNNPLSKDSIRNSIDYRNPNEDNSEIMKMRNLSNIYKNIINIDSKNPLIENDFSINLDYKDKYKITLGNKSSSASPINYNKKEKPKTIEFSTSGIKKLNVYGNNNSIFYNNVDPNNKTITVVNKKDMNECNINDNNINFNRGINNVNNNDSLYNHYPKQGDLRIDLIIKKKLIK